MSTKILLTAKHELRLVMNTQLRQAINLLQYNSIELKQLLQQCMEKNPFIELEEELAREEQDTPVYVKPTIKQVSLAKHDDNFIENYANPKSLRDHLLDQTLLCQFNTKQQFLAEAIIDAINEEGRLTMSAIDIQQTLSQQIKVEIDEIQAVIETIQSMDPIGVGCETLQACLSIQLQTKQPKDATLELAQTIINDKFDILIDQGIKKLAQALKLPRANIEAAIDLIRSLDPKPGLKYASENEIIMEPDLYVKKIKDTWHVMLVNNLFTNLKINNQYQELIKKYKSHQSYDALQKELQEAQWLMKSLKRRNETLFNVACHIIEYQKDFLDYGQAFMKPMNIIDVAQALGLHESTISRVTAGKYIATPRGMFELKYFFPSYVLTATGDTCSATKVKEIIKEIVSKETIEHVYSDSDIADLLKEEGINIARRTVTKYREAMKILPSYQRAQQLARSN